MHGLKYCKWNVVRRISRARSELNWKEKKKKISIPCAANDE